MEDTFIAVSVCLALYLFIGAAWGIRIYYAEDTFPIGWMVIPVTAIVWPALLWIVIRRS